MDLKRPPADLLAVLPKAASNSVDAAAAMGCAADLRWLFEALARGDSLRINCSGDDYAAKDGRPWSRDRFFMSGMLHGEGNGYPHVFTLGIANTEDDFLYQTHRWFPTDQLQPHGYRFPVPIGEYEVTLHFAEIYHPKPKLRGVAVLLEGREVLTDHDPCQAGFVAAETKAVRVGVEDGLLDITFRPAVEYPMVCAIEVRRLPDGGQDAGAGGGKK